MQSIASFFPQNYFIFLLHDKVVLYRFNTAFWDQKEFKEKKEYIISEEQSLEDIFAKIRKTYRSSVDDSWFLGLALRYFTLIKFSLPIEAQENLDQAVQYALMRHIPYDIHLAYTHYNARIDDQEILIDATILPKEPVQEYLGLISASGITLSAIFPSLALWAWQKNETGTYMFGGGSYAEIIAWKTGSTLFHADESSNDMTAGEKLFQRVYPALENLPGLTRQFFVWEPELKNFAVDACIDEPLKMHRLHDPASSVSKHIGVFPYQINLEPLSTLKNKKKLFVVRLVAFFLLALALASYPVAKLAGKKQALKNIQEKTFSLKKQAASMASLRKKNQDLLAGIQKLSGEIKDQVQVVELLKEITEITPKDAWLNSLFFSKKQVQLQGQAKSAIVIIEALENSPLFEEVHFDSPITKKNDLENFKIVAELE